MNKVTRVLGRFCVVSEVLGISYLIIYTLNMGMTDILQRIQYELKVVEACFDTIKGLPLRYRWNYCMTVFT